MAEEKQEKKRKPEQKPEKKEQKPKKEEIIDLVRITATDIPASLSIYAGLTRIKGISWAMSNAVCHVLNIDKKRKILSLSPKEIETIEAFIKNPKLPEWVLNRRRDIETGVTKHLITTELDLQREFDVRRLKKIRSYRGIRHTLGLPVRGQRTRAHFRKGRAVGVRRAKVQPGRKK